MNKRDKSRETLSFADHGEEVLFLELEDRILARKILKRILLPFAGTEVYIKKTKTKKEIEEQRHRIKTLFSVGPLSGDYNRVAAIEKVSLSTVRRVIDGKT